MAKARKNYKDKETVYIIYNTISNGIYIGKTSNYSQRISRHKTQLKSNKHINKKLQEDYNKYGVDTFIFFPLCWKKSVSSIETNLIKLISRYNPYCYNVVNNKKRQPIAKAKLISVENNPQTKNILNVLENLETFISKR